jgi:2-phosphosulfolactate phosphatase
VTGQTAYRVRFDWGLTGARALVEDAGPGDVAVVVDVLSFTTTLTVAVERGIEVYPFPWAAEGAPAYAESRGAMLALGRREGLSTGAVSLSPASFDHIEGVERVVLPSPNGSAIAFALADAGVRVVGACLRNASAVGAWLAQSAGTVSVVAAGERWPDDSLRPAVEDLWGAGAVLDSLAAAGSVDGMSPEAWMAVSAYAAVSGRLASVLPDAESGRELVAAGFQRDVEIAAAVDLSTVVPRMADGGFVAEPPH